MTYDEAVESVRLNPFNIQFVPVEIVDERLLRFARKGNPWAVDVWIGSVPKPNRGIAKDVFVDIGLVRNYQDLT